MSQIDLGWMRYGNGVFQHRWRYDQQLGMLRSYCHSIWRFGSLQEMLLNDWPVQPKCQRCLKVQNRVVD